MERNFAVGLDGSIKKLGDIDRVVSEIEQIDFQGSIDSSRAANDLLLIINVTNDVNPSIAISSIAGVASCNEYGDGLLSKGWKI